MLTLTRRISQYRHRETDKLLRRHDGYIRSTAATLALKEKYIHGDIAEDLEQAAREKLWSVAESPKGRPKPGSGRTKHTDSWWRRRIKWAIQDELDKRRAKKRQRPEITFTDAGAELAMLGDDYFELYFAE